MRGQAILVTLGLAFSGARAATPIDWEVIGSEDFRATIDRIVSNDVVDCGFLEITGKPTRNQRKSVLDCIEGAKKRGKEFIFATSRVPGDSYVQEVFATSVSGEKWLLTFDRHPLEDVEQIWVTRCSAITVNSKTLEISGVNCVEAQPPPPGNS